MSPVLLVPLPLVMNSLLRDSPGQPGVVSGLSLN